MFDMKDKQTAEHEKLVFNTKNFVRWFTSLDVEKDVSFDYKQIKYRELMRKNNEVQLT